MYEKENKELALKVGFYKMTTPAEFTGMWTIEGSGYCDFNPPNFYDPETGIAACFKWIEPLLSYYLINYADGEHVVLLEYNKKMETFADKQPQVAFAEAARKVLG